MSHSTAQPTRMVTAQYYVVALCDTPRRFLGQTGTYGPLAEAAKFQSPADAREYLRGQPELCLGQITIMLAQEGEVKQPNGRWQSYREARAL